MTAATTRRPALVVAIRAIAALTVIGSAAAVTTLTIRDDPQPTAAIAEEQSPATTSAAASPTPIAVAPAPLPADPVTAAPLPGAPAVGAVPNSAVPLGTGGAAPAASAPPASGNGPNSAVPLGTGTVPNPSVPVGQNTAPDGSVPLAAGSPFATVPTNTQPACPLGWPAPKQQGGLASLIGLAPLAGPFSSEAFALGSVYQPILQLVGPVLAEIAPVITSHQPLLAPFIAQVQSVEALVLEAILPYYGPYRAQLIAAEGDLAKTLAPILNNAYNSEIASCFVAWQSQIIDQSKGGRITVASLAHPGTVVELGPEI